MSGTAAQAPGRLLSGARFVQWSAFVIPFAFVSLLFDFATGPHDSPLYPQARNEMRDLFWMAMAVRERTGHVPDTAQEVLDSAAKLSLSVLGGQLARDDPWGHPYLLERADGAQGGVRIRSLGADGRPGGAWDAMDFIMQRNRLKFVSGSDYLESQQCRAMGHILLLIAPALGVVAVLYGWRIERRYSQVRARVERSGCLVAALFIAYVVIFAFR